jgi:hypothetical protein
MIRDSHSPIMSTLLGVSRKLNLQNQHSSPRFRIASSRKFLCKKRTQKRNYRFLITWFSIQQVLSSICFAVKDAGNDFSEEFYDTLRRQLEKNKDIIKQENQEMIAQAVRDNPNLRNLERFFKSSL